MKISHLYEDFTVPSVGDRLIVKPDITKEMWNAISIWGAENQASLSNVVLDKIYEGDISKWSFNLHDATPSFIEKYNLYNCMWFQISCGWVVPCTFFTKCE